MKISLVVVAITILSSVDCLFGEVRSNKAQKTLGFLKNIHDRMLSSRFARSVFSSKEEDEEDDEDEEENWGSKENAEFFFSIFDQNNDGLIEEQELWSFFEAMSYNEMDIKQMVDNVFQMDFDRDSYLSVDEITNAMEKGYL